MKRKLPGFKACMAMMRKHNRQTREDGFHLLLPRASEHVEELLHEFHAEKHDHGLRCWLLELIGEAADVRTMDVLVQQLRSDDEALRDWAIAGLRRLDTHEARTALFEAGIPRVPNRGG